jgi:hypothetical protein
MAKGSEPADRPGYRLRKVAADTAKTQRGRMGPEDPWTFEVSSIRKATPADFPASSSSELPAQTHGRVDSES